LRLASDYEAYRKTTLNLIASENVLSHDVLRALSSQMAGRYAGRPESYGGSSMFHRMWEQCERLAEQVFRTKAASVTPVSGHIAAMMVLEALARPGDKIATLSPEDGGYRGYAPGYLPDVLGLKSFALPFDRRRMNLDVEAAAALVRREKPSVIILGATVFLFPHPVAAISEAAHSYGGRVFYDGSHVLGLLAGREFQDPIREGADVVAGSTHKTLFGPQGGIIFSNEDELINRIEGRYLYRSMDNFHLNRVAALGVALEEIKLHASAYAQRIVRNSKALAEGLDSSGFELAARDFGYTLSHQVLLRAGEKGEQVRDGLEKAGIIVDSRVRFGTGEVTRRGMGPLQMAEIARLARIAIIEGGALKARKRVKAMAKEFSRVLYTLGSR